MSVTSREIYTLVMFNIILNTSNGSIACERAENISPFPSVFSNVLFLALFFKLEVV